MKRRFSLTTMLAAAAMGLCLFGGAAPAAAQSTFGSAQWASNGDSYSLAFKGLGTDKIVAWYDVGKTKPRAWFAYGPAAGTNLTDGTAVAGGGGILFYEFARSTRIGATLSGAYVWPQGGKGAFVFGFGIGLRMCHVPADPGAACRDVGVIAATHVPPMGTSAATQ